MTARPAYVAGLAASTTRIAHATADAHAVADAVANARAFRTRATLLTEDNKVADCLLGLLDEIPCAGKQIHDANVVATMLVHGIDCLITTNLADFTRFGHHIRLIPLSSVT